MGMYTEIVFRADLDPSRMTQADQTALGLLFHDGIYRSVEREQLPIHSLFDTPRWRQLFTTYSFYHAGCAARALTVEPSCTKVAGAGHLKNYDQEVELFLDWVAPFLISRHRGDGFLGWMRYEEDDHSTGLWHDANGITKTPLYQTKECTHD